METLKYRVIKNEKQYSEYCSRLEELITSNNRSEITRDEIELITLLIEKWDEQHNAFEDVEPVELLKALMVEKRISSIDLAGILNVSKGLVSDIINCRKGLSKDVIRALADYFKVSQEAFNKTYQLKTRLNNLRENVRATKREKNLQGD